MSTPEKLEAFAGAVVAQASGVTGIKAFLDPLLIMALIQAIVTILQQCRKDPDEVVDAAKKPGILARLAVRRAIKKQIKALGGRPKDEDIGALVDASFELGAKVDADDVQEVMLQL